MAVASPSVIKLEGQRNWSVWKFQVTVTLKGVDVFSVIDGTFVESETGDKTAWVKKDVKAQSIIVSRLSEEAMIHVLTCETAAEMWKKLHSVFESKSATSTLMLQQRFLQCKFEEGELSIYLAKLQEMACQLKQAGETVSEKFLMTKVLMSLPESYSHFVSAWESVDTDKQNFNDLVARLLVEEERIQSKGHESESTALFLKKSGFVKRCNRCYVPGHLAKDCNSKVENRRCFSCGKIGHLKGQCKKGNRNKNSGQYGGGHSKGNAFTVIGMITGTGCEYLSDSSGIDNRSVNQFKNKWLMDSGASAHMTGERELFTDYTSVSNRFVIVGDGRRLRVAGTGKVELNIYNGESYVQSTLHNALHVPDLRVSLFSLSTVTKKGHKVEMTCSQCLLWKDNKLCAVGNREGENYILNVMKDVCNSVAAVATLSNWHERLCHQNVEQVKQVLTKNNIKYTGDSFKCVPCLEGKMHKLPFAKSEHRANAPLELLSAELCGPMEVESVGGSRYFLLIKDNYSNYRVVYFLKKKSEAVLCIKRFVAWAERQTNYNVKVIRTDNGLEFCNDEMCKFVQENGIQHQTTVPYTPQQNGKAERDMRTLVEAARTMLKAKRLPKHLWAEAVNTSVYVLNRTSKSKQESQSPYESFHKREVNINDLKGVFGE
ncbi:unnamed protein product [Euphydryas editha]|uniref:Copia protein n=1 Tax=Euphydryas editha TaxID=104508 RepID=A0AAU9TT15_EUPED|nr:unnamed protein product [Euphydryas editha]